MVTREEVDRLEAIRDEIKNLLSETKDEKSAENWLEKREKDQRDSG